MNSDTYLVSGASGFIASWICKLLLEQGAKVHGTVRSLDNKKKVQHLLDLQNKYPDQFHLFEADLLIEGSFDSAMQGCQYVLHTASPFFVGNIKNAQKSLIDPALKGTQNILNSVNRTDSVKKVVLTSSVVAIFSDNAEIQDIPDGIFTNQVWNKTASESYQPYAYSKTVAEKKARQMAAAQDRWALSTINPGFVLGPSLSNRVDGTSTKTVYEIMSGKMAFGLPEINMGMVDVRDVAQAHINAATTQTQSDRFILVGHHAAISDWLPFLEKYKGKYKIPTSKIPKPLLYIFGPLQGFTWKYVSKNVGIPISFDNKPSIDELGIQYRELEKTLDDQIHSLIEKELV